jgi:hypothetical protein
MIDLTAARSRLIWESMEKPESSNLIFKVPMSLLQLWYRLLKNRRRRREREKVVPTFNSGDDLAVMIKAISMDNTKYALNHVDIEDFGGGILTATMISSQWKK